MLEVNEAASNSEENNDFIEAQNDLQRAIMNSFMLLTTNDSKNVSVTDLGKIIRHLGCVPSERELSEFANNVVNTKEPETVKLRAFVTHAEKEIRAFRYKPASIDELLRAFRTLDTENKGSLSVEFMREVLREGESFNDDEITEALKFAYDPNVETIQYDLWIHKLSGKTKIDVYALIPDPAKRAAQETEELNRLLSNG